MNNKDLLTEENVNRIDNMLRKLANMKINGGHLKMDLEDVVSELWINVLKIIEKTGNLDFNYIAKASLFKMVDLTRYNVAREATPYDTAMLERVAPEEFRNTSDGDTGHKYDTYVFTTCKPQSATERCDLLDILHLFKKDSNEYKFVEAWMRILGILEDVDCMELPERAFDGYIAVQVLGYAGSKSSGYARCRQKVRDALVKAGYYYSF